MLKNRLNMLMTLAPMLIAALSVPHPAAPEPRRKKKEGAFDLAAFQAKHDLFRAKHALASEISLWNARVEEEKAAKKAAKAARRALAGGRR